MSGSPARRLNWQIFYDVVVFLSALLRQGGAGAFLCRLCMFDLLLWHLKGRECKSKPQFSPAARVVNRPLLLLGNNCLSHDSMCLVDARGQDLATWKHSPLWSTVLLLFAPGSAWCFRGFCRTLFSSSSVFTKRSETPFELCSFSDSLSHEQRWGSLCRLNLPSFLLSVLPLQCSLSTFFLTVPDYISRHVGVIVLSKPLKFILHKGECNLIGGGDVCQSRWWRASAEWADGSEGVGAGVGDDASASIHDWRRSTCLGVIFSRIWGLF